MGRQLGFSASALALAAACTAPNPDFAPPAFGDGSIVTQDADGDLAAGDLAVPDLAAGDLAIPDLAPAELAMLDAASSDAKPDQAVTLDLVVAQDLVTPPDMTGCAGWRPPKNYCNDVVKGGCWYLSPDNTTCAATCATHGGFDSVAAQHGRGASVPDPCSTPVVSAIAPACTERLPGGNGYEWYEEGIVGGQFVRRCWTSDDTSVDGTEPSGFLHRACACKQ